MKISVKQKHIDNGRPHESCRCPIAIAAQEQNPEYQYILVGPQTIQFNDLDNLYEAVLPDFAANFIQDFDRGKYVRPFEFEVQLEKVEQ